MYADANVCVSPPRAPPGSLAATLASFEALTQGSDSNANTNTNSNGNGNANDSTDSGGGGDENHSTASRLSSLFGRTSFRPQSPPAQCVGQMVTSGMTRGSGTKAASHR